MLYNSNIGFYLISLDFHFFFKLPQVKDTDSITDSPYNPGLSSSQVPEIVCAVYKHLLIPKSTLVVTSWVALVTPTDRPKSVRNRCLIRTFCGVVCVVTCPFDISVGVGAFVIGLGHISSFLSLYKKAEQNFKHRASFGQYIT